MKYRLKIKIIVDTPLILLHTLTMRMTMYICFLHVCTIHVTIALRSLHSTKLVCSVTAQQGGLNGSTEYTDAIK